MCEQIGTWHVIDFLHSITELIWQLKARREWIGTVLRTTMIQALTMYYLYYNPSMRSYTWIAHVQNF